jgi:hypothetical protein
MMPVNGRESWCIWKMRGNGRVIWVIGLISIQGEDDIVLLFLHVLYPSL